MAIEQFGTSPVFALVGYPGQSGIIRILHPRPQKRRDLIVRPVALALINVRRGMIGVVRGCGLNHWPPDVIVRAVHTVRTGCLEVVRSVPLAVAASYRKFAAMQVGDGVAI